MNFIRKKINKWLIRREIKQAITDFEDTLEYIQDRRNSYMECHVYAQKKVTHRGLCDYFKYHKPIKLGLIVGCLGLIECRYMFHFHGAHHLTDFGWLELYSSNSWKVIAANLYQQRINYLKKFI
jgi:hypothetical protein